MQDDTPKNSFSLERARIFIGLAADYLEARQQIEAEQLARKLREIEREEAARGILPPGKDDCRAFGASRNSFLYERKGVF